MRFSCDGCGSQYMISDDKVGPNGVKVRCKKCGNVVSVKHAPSVAPEIAPEPPSPDPEARAEGSGGESTLERELGDAFDSVFGGGSIGLASDGGSFGAPASYENGSAPAATDDRAPADTSEETAPEEAPAPAAESAPASTEEIVDWYVAVDEKQVGPLQATGVKARWESGEIGPDTLAWRPGMADWVPLSTIAEMAQYLAPVPNGGSRSVAAPAPAAELRAESSSPAPVPFAAGETAPAAPVSPNVTNGAANGHDTSWKPSAASALAALANAEIASLQRPEPKKEEPAPAQGGSLLERMDLPDGGVDPTNVLPLPIKGLEPTGEATLPKKKPAPAATEVSELSRIKKSATRSVLAIGVAMAVLFAGGVAVVIWKLQPGREAHPAPVAQAPVPAIPAPAAAPRPAPAAAEPAPAPSASASAPAAPAAVPGAPPPPAQPAPAAAAVAAAAPAASAPPRPVPEPMASASQAAPQRAAPPRAAAPEPPSRTHANAKAEPPPRPAPARKGQRLASAERAPAPAPPPPAAEPPRKKSGGDPLLDVGGDDEVEKELSGKGTKRSVYVPPAMGSDLSENVSVSQINEAVVGQKAALMRCIEQQRAADPDTRGTLKVRWIIAGDGTVRDVRLLNSEFARQPIAHCITTVVKGIRFPRSRTTGQEVVFPFKF